eukprot:s1872_g7.t1
MSQQLLLQGSPVLVAVVLVLALVLLLVLALLLLVLAWVLLLVLAWVLLLTEISQAPLSEAPLAAQRLNPVREFDLGLGRRDGNAN